MTSSEIRQKYLDFFKSKDHKIIDSASLLPENDPTVLFTTAGMHPLVPYLLGQSHPAGRRLCSAQKCVRTGDIEEVGDLTHLTFFEMLGNWSLGDYFKKEAIDYSYEFLTSPQWLGLDKDKLAVSVFVGDDNAPFDEESYNFWLAKGLAPERLAKLGKEDNWWGPAGQTGPCGPDTEMFYWTGEGAAPLIFDPEDKRWVEIWNDVFMAYEKKADGSFTELQQKNVDTGMGLERVLTILSGQTDIYQTDLFSDIIAEISALSHKDYREHLKEFRIIADHLRAVVFIVGDNKGVSPANTDQGYIVRRLIRRAIRYGRILGIDTENFCWQLAQKIISHYQTHYAELAKNQSFIKDNLIQEEQKFSQVIERGLKEFSKANGDISAKLAFDLYQSYGFPIEITEELAKEKGLVVDLAGFEAELAKHQELSRTASAGKFKGGLADHSEITTKFHTATHLLLAALRQVLGDHVYQRGSNITAERLRFDFSHPDKLSSEQLQQVEALVNQAIEAQLPVVCEEMSLSAAKEQGAMGIFESKYDDQVKVYTVGAEPKIFSQEICGGPHVANTKDLGHFRITKEESSSSGVRRIKAILE